MAAISSISIILIKAEVAPFGASTVRGVHIERTALLVRLEDDLGRAGWGETFAALSTTSSPLIAIAAETFATRLLHRDPRERGLMYRELRDASRGMGSLAARALGAVDVALWDLLGQGEQASISSLLGLRGEGSYPAVATAVFYDSRVPESIEGRVTHVRKLSDAGFQGIKAKVGALPVALDIQHVDAMAAAAGPSTMLAVDANSGYVEATAIQMARELRARQVFWFEEPTAIRATAAYRRIRGVGPRISAGQDLNSAAEFLPLLEARAIDIAQPSVASIGGLTGALALGSLAQAFDVNVVPTGWGTGILLAASLHLRHALASETALPAPDFDWIEVDVTDNPLRDGILRDPIRPVAGRLNVPPGPGLGIVVDDNAVERLATDIATFP